MLVTLLSRTWKRNAEHLIPRPPLLTSVWHFCLFLQKMKLRSEEAVSKSVLLIDQINWCGERSGVWR